MAFLPGETQPTNATSAPPQPDSGLPNCTADPTNAFCKSRAQLQSLSNYCDTHQTDAFCQMLSGSNTSPTTQPCRCTSSSLCIKPAAYVVDTADTKPCPNTQQQPPTPPPDCSTTGYNIPGMEQNLEKNAAPPPPIGEIINGIPDVTTKKPDSTVVTTEPDGTVITRYPSGQNPMTMTTKPDGTTIEGLSGGDTLTTKPDHTIIVATQNGVTLTWQPDGTFIVADPDGSTSTKPDGTEIVGNKDSGWHIIFPKKPDGSVSTYYENGTTFTMMPEGRTIVH
jgi:hypothetical protein